MKIYSGKSLNERKVKRMIGGTLASHHFSPYDNILLFPIESSFTYDSEIGGIYLLCMHRNVNKRTQVHMLDVTGTKGVTLWSTT